jgi:hypothetical protein
LGSFALLASFIVGSALGESEQPGSVGGTLQFVGVVRIVKPLMA